MRNFFVFLSLVFSLSLQAQFPGMQGGAAMQNMNVGHFYGKVVDADNKGLDGASILLTGNIFDSSAKKMVPGTISAGITSPNGDFSLNNLPVMGNFTLVVSAIGYKTVEDKVSFGIKRPQGGTGQAAGGREQMMSMVDKDLGNITLKADPSNLGNVTVVAAKQLFEMGVDRKIFNVDKNLVSAGQSATEVMRTIPTLSVDIDGNVTMRNSTPQLFVDGRPTTLTLDQIPADLIEKVELITNPSAKFDASGGNAGILNVVLKKNKKVGYNGGLRTGVDSRGKMNLGGDINLRQNKINLFANAMYNERKSKNWTINDRTNFNSPTRVYQDGNGVNEGYFAFLRGGFDYFIDNRNTISFTGNITRGNFNNTNYQQIDSFTNAVKNAYNLVNQGSAFNFKNTGAQVSFKHNFAKPGHEWTADGNYNKSNNDNENLINTQTVYNTGSRYVIQQSMGGGISKNVVIQTDYANPISDNKKIELGARASIRDFENNIDQAFYNFSTNKFENSASLTNRYQYTDKVFAAYGTYSYKVKKWNFQFGLRAESSNYSGILKLKSKAGADSTANFSVDFPASFFPSTFITYKLSDKEDVQLNYSRRINRPNFFQLMPFIDFSDPQNISVGNANLKPEFTNSYEISYNNNYKKGANFLVSTYFKQNNNLITRYQYIGVNPDPAGNYSTTDSLIYNSYVNANKSFTYGVELTNKMPVTKWWDMTANFNLFNSSVTVIDPKLGNTTNERVSWFFKLNNSIKLPKNFSIQLSGDYYARTVVPQEGGRGGRGGGMFGGGPTATAQGYIDARYSFDIALRKDWTWKNGRSGSLTLSMNDFARTQLYSTFTESPYFVQTSQRRRDPQVLRMNFNYRFGKFDVNLFKRKNTKADQGGGTDMMMGQ